MEVIVDSREGALFEALKTKKTKEWITTGDVAIKQNGKIKVIIERKTLSDMMASIIDKRCDKQIQQMKEVQQKTGCIIMFIIEAGRVYNGVNINVDSINTKLRSFVLQNIPYVRTKNIEDTAEYIQLLVNDLAKRDLEMTTSSSMHAASPVVLSTSTSSESSSSEDENDILH